MVDKTTSGSHGSDPLTSTSPSDPVETIAHQATRRPTLSSPTWTVFILLLALLFTVWGVMLIGTVNRQQRVVNYDFELMAKLNGLEQALGQLATGVTEAEAEIHTAPSDDRWHQLVTEYHTQAQVVASHDITGRVAGELLKVTNAAVARMGALRGRILSSLPGSTERKRWLTEFHKQAIPALDRVRETVHATRGKLVNESLILAANDGSLRMLILAALVMAAFVAVLLFTLKRTYVMLWHSEARLRLLIEQFPAVLWTTDTKSKITSFLGSELSRLNIEPQPNGGARASEAAQADEADSLPAVLQRRSRLDQSTYEVQWQGRALLAHVEPLYDANDHHIGNVGVALDITERKQAEKEVAAEKERLAVTLRSIGDGVITTDTAGLVVLLNKVAETLTGWTQQQAAGKPLREVFRVIHEKTGERRESAAEQVLKTGGPVNLSNHTLLIAKDGNGRIIADSGAPIRDHDGNIIGAVQVFRDITNQQRIEEDRQKASKLESLGILAGGIAHDFNNILTAILANVSLAKIEAEAEGEPFRMLAEAENACLRARDLTQQLLTFSKGGLPMKKTVSISELITGSTNFVLRGSNVGCEFFIPDNLSPVEIDLGQINQVINNLIINAKQAMPGGGAIRIEAENMTVGPTSPLPLQEGEFIKILIKDRGVGIPENILPKIFDPYFTTKQEGSGLGLATTYSIIKHHDGHIAVESEPGVGTTFTIYLPASQRMASSEEPLEALPLVRGGKVLVMDDEQNIRQGAARMLKHLGYEVGCVKDGTEALEAYKQAKENGHPFDAVIVDLTIPGGVGGREAMQKLMAIDPQVRGIVCSGHSYDPVMADFNQYGFRDLIVKPYTIEELSRTLRRVMNGNGAAPESAIR